MSTLNPSSERRYFDLHLTGIGYLNRVREVSTKGGGTFLSVTVAALWGRMESPQYTRFECTVSGEKTRCLVRKIQEPVNAEKKVLVGFTLSDLSADPFTFSTGPKEGEVGVRLRSRLLGLSWVRVDGQPFYTPHPRDQEPESASVTDEPSF